MKYPVRFLSFCLILLLSYLTGSGQNCITLGQNPTTAFPVCGYTNFDQKTVPACGNRKIPTPCNDGASYSDINPFWYKFTCYQSGTLGFTIAPYNANDDYDWELFDITNANPMDVYTNSSLIISANWSGMYGATGAGPTGKKWYECASASVNGNPTFSTMPTLIAGHNYILLVSNFSPSQVGYKLSFSGGTASIVDPVTPLLNHAYAVCDGSQVILVLNKKMNCSSLEIGGTDFSITGSSPNAIKAATGKGCAFSFDMDTVVLDLQTDLTPGTFTISAKRGSDSNTITDNCGNELPIGSSKTITFTASVPTPMDSMMPVICMQDTLTLVFKKPIDCSTIAADGSDFAITGPSTVNIKSARAGQCVGGVSSTVQVILSKAIRVNGNYTIRLRNGTDANTLIDECGQITAAGSALGFQIKNVVTADYNAMVKTGCKYDTLQLFHDGNNQTKQWNWTIDSTITSNLQNPVIRSNHFGQISVSLKVSNGFCPDSSFSLLELPDQTVKAGFSIPDTICAADSLILLNTSSNNASSWNWNFGNGLVSNLQQPESFQYQLNTRQNIFTIRLIVKNGFNCSDTTFKRILVMANCYIDIPSAFTPNGDGLNDYLYPLNAFKAADLSFKIYNRSGQVIYETNDWHSKWDGRSKGELQPSGAYVWTLDYTHKDTGKIFHLKGTTVLIR